VTDAGLGLYAVEGSCQCPEYLLVSLAELAVHGIQGMAHVLPVPVGPVPRTLAMVEDELTGVSLSLYEEELLTERLRWALASAKRGRARLRARVAELEAERHTTNEALDDAVQELRANAQHALPWAHEMPDDDLSGFLNDLVSAAMGRWQSDPEVPDREVLAAVEKACAAWRTPGAGYRSDPEPDECACPPADQPGPHQVGCFFDGVPVSPPSERPVNGLTAAYMPVAALREDVSPQVEKLRNLLAGQCASLEDPHDGPLAHSYRVPHDLPVPGTCRLDAAGLDEVGQHFSGGAS
jgi:hypothetical protein